jgi:hypothetical protein
MGKGPQNGMGLVEGHTLLAEGNDAVSGPIQGPYDSICSPRPHEVFDLCALGLPQVKASGLVQVYDLFGRISL